VGAIVVAALLIGTGTDKNASAPVDDGVARTSTDPAQGAAQRAVDTAKVSPRADMVFGEPPGAEPASADAALVRFRLSTTQSGGEVYCGLFAKDSWPGLAVQFDIEPVGGDTVVCEFEKVKPGEYAAAAFHDQNGNENLDLSWLGLPEEDWTFSQDVHQLLPLPTFDRIKFDVDGDRTTVTADLG
jgi:uncharacterized protein (DUF2141 family)